MSGENYQISLYLDSQDQPETFERIANMLAWPAFATSGEVHLVTPIRRKKFSLSELPEIIQEYALRLSEVEMIEIGYAVHHRSGDDHRHYLVWNGTSPDSKRNFSSQSDPPIRLKVESEYVGVEAVLRSDVWSEPLRECMALFLDLCGLTNSLEHRVDHATFGLSIGVDFAEQAWVIYHCDVHQFAYDLVRSIITMQSGVQLTTLLRDMSDPTQLTEEIIQEQLSSLSLRQSYGTRYELPERPNKEYYEEALAKHPRGMAVYDYKLAVYQYQSRLTPERIQRVLELPAERIRALIIETCQKEYDLVCYDYEERGLVVAFDLDAYMWIGEGYEFSSLYKIYDRLLDEVGV